MKILLYVASALCLPALFSGCSVKDYGDLSFVQSAAAPTDGSALFNITTDNSGLVTITPGGAGASSFDIYFGDGATTPVNVLPGKNTTHVYKEGSYTVKIVSNAINGKQTESTHKLDVKFRAPEELKVSTSTDVHKLTVSATALYAPAGFQVFFGEVPNEQPVALAAGSSVNHTYANAGTYNVKVVALSGGAATTTNTQAIKIYDSLLLPMTFELPTVNYNWGDFGGSSTTVIPNPQRSGINTSATVGKIVKNPPEVWAGNYIILSKPLDFSVNKKIKVKVFAPRIGMRIWLQLERSGDNSFKEAKEVATTKANEWEELTFDFTGVINDNSKRLQNILFFLDDGTRGDGSPNYTILFDDIILTN